MNESYISQYLEQYVITLESELQRQKEKNQILQERLKNKQIFIIEMKNMQIEFQIYSQKCKNQLSQERDKREYLQKFTVREQAQLIAELRHQLQYLSSQLAGSQKNYEMKRNKSAPKFVNEAIIKKVKDEKYLSRGLQQIQQKQNEDSQLYKNFAFRFIQMFEIYNRVEDIGKTKKNLKAGWKWIKQLVKSYTQIQSKLKQIFEYAQRCSQENQNCDPQSILKLKQNL